MPFLPKQAANSCLRRARRFLELADGPLPVEHMRNDMRRMALVMAVAAIDSYMHALVLRRVGSVRKATQLPKALARVEIPFSEIASLADASIKAQREDRASRPWVKVKNSLQLRLLKETFQSSEQVATAFSMSGVEHAWSEIAGVLGEPAERSKKRLNALVHRRHQIVHEGDIKRAQRPRRLKFNSITQASAKTEVDWVDALINAIDKVVAKES